MKIHDSLEDFSPLDFSVVTIGTFDGVHIGHQKILQRLQSIAAAHHGETVLITFWPHPRLVLHPEDTNLKLLSTFDEKADLLDSFGVDHLVRIPFTREFSQLTSQEFIQRVLIDGVHTHKLVIGYDHRFGRNREGSFEHLKANAPQLGFEVEEIPRQEIDHVGVSSTKIRMALSEGNTSLAADFLGRDYSLSGVVIPGNKLGKSLGYPTANLQVLDHFKLIPADGTYAVRVKLGDQYYGGMLNSGTRPTIEHAGRSIEVHLFDFNSDIYGRELTVEFRKRLRPEMKFSDLEALKAQLLEDEKQARKILAL